MHYVQREDGEWEELKFKPRRIEVHDDIICLLSGYSGAHKALNNYSAEINIKRGTKIKYSTNCKNSLARLLYSNRTPTNEGK
ncbi:hypothetical protein VC1_52 [Vibrio phage Vc1]|uniref:Uncharacterized protein n=1 Tax=Vibrio phage Vc1 TaxID=1480731 RepID=A0A9X9TDA6_9CAUD|nr:hypothetical protein KMB90_gp52 [Vibrio virus 2019VC1]